MRSILLIILYLECCFFFFILCIKWELFFFKFDIIYIVIFFNMGFCGLYYVKKLNILVVGFYYIDFDVYLCYYKIEFFFNMFWNYLKWFYSYM